VKKKCQSTAEVTMWTEEEVMNLKEQQKTVPSPPRHWVKIPWKLDTVRQGTRALLGYSREEVTSEKTRGRFPDLLYPWKRNSDSAKGREWGNSEYGTPSGGPND